LVVIRCREVLESVIGGPEVQGSVGVSYWWSLGAGKCWSQSSVVLRCRGV